MMSNLRMTAMAVYITFAIRICLLETGDVLALEMREQLDSTVLNKSNVSK